MMSYFWFCQSDDGEMASQCNSSGMSEIEHLLICIKAICIISYDLSVHMFQDILGKIRGKNTDLEVGGSGTIFLIN